MLNKYTDQGKIEVEINNLKRRMAHLIFKKTYTRLDSNKVARIQARIADMRKGTVTPYYIVK